MKIKCGLNGTNFCKKFSNRRNESIAFVRMSLLLIQKCSKHDFQLLQNALTYNLPKPVGSKVIYIRWYM